MTERIYKILVCLFCFASSGLAEEKQATVRLKVVDESGIAVPNAQMRIVFRGYQVGESVDVAKKTDDQGALVAQGWPEAEFMSNVDVVSDDSRYYTSRLTDGAVNKWNFDFNMIVRKVGTPIPMYAKKIVLKLPELRKEIGFDFQKGDWVKPYGNGEVTDCTFIGTKSFEDRYNFKTTVIVSFPHEKTGMLIDAVADKKTFKQSMFKGSRFAPDHGFQHAFEFTALKKDGQREGSSMATTYLFRCRPNIDHNGELKGYHYGKIVKCMSVAGGAAIADAKPEVSFTYYFNPTPNDRNLEFDPDQNLFGKLDWEEAVRDP